ncbi:MAG: inner membrane protein YpjD [Wenzhouxiangellaceae bacterium]
MSPTEILLPFSVAVYLIAAVLVAYHIRNDRAVFQHLGVVLTTFGVGAHAAAIWLEMNSIGGFNADFFSTLALVSLLNLVVVLVGMLRWSWSDLLILALPGTAGLVLLKMLLAPDPVALDTGGEMLDLHVATSLLSYSMLSIAAITALFIALQHRLLRAHSRPTVIEILPPLVTMETMLFQMIAAGWVLLTASLVTGLLFVDDLMAQHLAHKTFLSILSWLIFGLLLAGRWRYGWRGMRAVRLCLIGMAILLLAYFGSKAVLELILERRWSA